MSKLKAGILREEKIPHDKRVPFTPDQCKQIVAEYPDVDLFIQPSDWRAYRNEEYENAGIILKENLSDCDLLIGIKEVPKQFLIPDKKYIFFSHTINKQRITGRC
jgi:saccharopine dehydrogenase (NAD+, L-lysine-forming)